MCPGTVAGLRDSTPERALTADHAGGVVSGDDRSGRARGLARHPRIMMLEPVRKRWICPHPRLRLGAQETVTGRAADPSETIGRVAPGRATDPGAGTFIIGTFIIGIEGGSF